MRILLATGILSPDIGGPANYVHNISVELVKLGHEVAVVTYSDINKYEMDNNYPYPIVRIVRKGVLSNYYRYFKEVFKLAEEFDLIYSFDYFSSGVPSLLAAKLRNKPVVIRNGGDLLWERYLSKTSSGLSLAEYYKKGLYKKSFFKFIIAKVVFGLADLLIFTSKLQGEIFEKYYQIDKRKIRYIYNPLPQIDNEIIHKGAESKEIIWAGRMVEKNNIKRLIKVFCDLPQQEFRLSLIGDGPQRESLAKYIKDKKCSKVFFKNRVSNKELMRIMSKSYAMILPSYTDISPNQALECLAIGLPFIITKEHGFDWLKNKVEEFNPTVEDEMKQSLIKIFDKSFYDEYRKKLSKIDYNYNFKEAAKDTIKVFNEVLYLK